MFRDLLLGLTAPALPATVIGPPAVVASNSQNFSKTVAEASRAVVSVPTRPKPVISLTETDALRAGVPLEVLKRLRSTHKTGQAHGQATGFISPSPGHITYFRRCGWCGRAIERRQ